MTRRITFRRMTVADLPHVYSWLAQPHVRQTYAPKALSYTEMVEKYAPRCEPDAAVQAYLLLAGEGSVGYLQAYRMSAFPDYDAVVRAGPGAAGLDLFIGEPGFLYQGLGSQAIAEFVDQVVFAQPDVIVCIAGPARDHIPSIRAFEKAGFGPWREITSPFGRRELLMRKERAPGVERAA